MKEEGVATLNSQGNPFLEEAKRLGSGVVCVASSMFRNLLHESLGRWAPASQCFDGERNKFHAKGLRFRQVLVVLDALTFACNVQRVRVAVDVGRRQRMLDRYVDRDGTCAKVNQEI